MAQKTSKGQEGYYARYKSGNVQAKNRKKRLERALKRQPENAQIKQALLDIHYRRRTPGSDGWSASGIRMAKIFKEFCGAFDKAILSSNAKQSAEAMQKLQSTKAGFKLSPEILASAAAKAPFSIAARATM